MLMNTAEYLSIIENIKSEIAAAQYRAAVHVNADMLLLYYDIGCVINEHKSWGNKFIDNLAADIRIAFPESKGYSVRNLKYMAKFAEIYPDREFVQQVVAQIPWGHNIVLLELGTGFAFLGNQYHLNVGGDDFYIDLLFYNLNLRCYVVIELKTGDFKPEYAGQLNFYLSAVDGILKKEQDNPSIGLLLCKNKNNVVAEYSLKDISKPIGVSEYKITSSLPDNLEKQLPSVEDIQKRIK